MAHAPRVVSSMVSWLITIVLSLTGAFTHATTCDVDADGDIDRNDYLAILADIGERASGPNDPRDADRNGRILSNDPQLCARRCTLPLCDIPTNKAPIAKNDAATTALDTRVRINVIANDRDRDGRIVPSTVTIVTNPQHGKVTKHRDGTVTYSPAPGFQGGDRFYYRVKDNDGATSNGARVRTTVESGNELPMADAGPNFNVATGARVTLNGSNSSDPDGDPLTFSWQFLSVPPASTVTNASLANRATPAPRFTTDVDGPYRLALKVSDGQMTDVDTVRVTAATANVPPNAAAGPDQSAVVGQIVDLDGRASSDPDAGPSPVAFRWFFVAVPAGSTLTDVNITGAATALASFAPDVAGAFRVGLEVDDGADTDQDEVVVTVSPSNVAPNANAGTDIVVQLGNQATLDSTASTDPDGGPAPLSYLWSFVSVPPTSAITNADLSGATTATPSFTPDVAGQYLLRLDVTDGDLTDMDQVQVKANVAPAAGNDGFTVVENTTLTEPAPGVFANDTDGNSDPLTAALVTDVGNGTLALNADGSFTYTPDTDFEGTDGFTYLANDGSADSNVATVTLTITHANEAPVAVNDAYTTDEDIPLVMAALGGVLGNDTDFESDPLTAVVDTVPANGTLTLNADGSLTYTPNPDFNGTDTFIYHANDGLSDSNVTTVNITVDAVNDVPSFTVGLDQTVLEDAGAQTANPWATGISPGPADEASQTVSFNVTGNTNPALFSAGPSVSATGVLTYTPAADASGSATITLTLADDGGTANGGVDTSAPQSFTITVDDINAPPSFTAGSNQTVNEDAGPQTVNPWATAIDDGDPTVTQTLTFNVTGNTNPALFSAGPSVSPTGVLTYTPATNASGTASITLTLSDDGGTTNGGDDTSPTQTFTITVNAVNDAPSFTAGPSQAVDEDSGAQSVSGWVTGISPGPTDESGQTVSFSVTANTNPSLFFAGPLVSPTGVLTFTPTPNAFGSATITLTLSDDGGTANGGVDTSTGQSFTITVNGVNDAPSFVSGGNVTVLEDAGPQSLAWATGISPGPANESGQTLSFLVSNNNNALFSAQPAVSPSGGLSFTPASNAFGSATVMVTLQDNGGTANGGADSFGPLSFTITVTPVNDPPVATAKSHQTHSGIRITIGAAGTGKLKDGATDVDDPFGDLAVSAIFGSITPAGATIVLTDAATGTFTYNPPAGFSGPASFQFQVCDDGAPTPPAMCSAPATVSFNVTGPDLWFVQQGASGTGRFTDPFGSLASLPAGRGTGDRIFVFTGTYGTGHTLFTNEHLIGQGSSGTFDSVLGVTVPGNGTLDARPALRGTRPQLNGTVALAGSSTVRGLNIASTTATGLSGGAVTGVSVSEASVTSTTGTAVNLTNSGGTVSFTSVSSNGAANGIVLNNTTGSFTVTGTGTAGSGGTIQNTTGRGASFISAQNISLTNMNFTNTASIDLDGDNSGLSTGDNLTTNAAIHLETVFTATLNGININSSAEQGINGHNVKDFTLQNSSITNAGNAADEDGIHFYNMLGTSSITNNTTISSSGDDNINVQNNTNAALPAGMTPVLNLAITNGSANTGVLGSGYLMGIRGTSAATVTIDGVTANNNFSGGVVIDTFDTATSTIEVKNSTITNNNDGISLSSNNGSTKFDIHDNTSFAGNDFARISILKAAFSTTGALQGKIRNNPIAVSDGQTADGIIVNQAGDGTLTASIIGNTITYRGTQRAINLQTGQDGAGALHVTATNNNIDVQLDGTGNAVNGILANSGVADPSGAGSFLCADIGGAGGLSNTFTHSLGGSLAGGDIRVRQRFSNNVQLPGYGGGATDTTAVGAYLDGRNAEVSPSTASFLSGSFVGGGACTQPVFP